MPVLISAAALRRTTLLADVPHEYREAQQDCEVADLCRGATTVLLHGPPGTGKTRFLWATFLRKRRSQLRAHWPDPAAGPEAPVLELSGPQVGWDDGPRNSPGVVRYPDGRRISRQPPPTHVRLVSEPGDVLRHRYDRAWLDALARHDGVLAFDDVGCVSASEWAMEVLYHVTNSRRANGSITLYATNLTPPQLGERYSPAISSRLCGGEVIQLAGTDHRLEPT